jgi:hypothetical protein
MTLHVSDRFKGYSDESVECIVVLKGLTILPNLTGCVKYGCTSGQCIIGSLSPMAPEACNRASN